jgi:hypothetical protein
MVATAKDAKGADVTVTASGVDSVDTSTAGTYTITFSSTACDNDGTTTVTVSEPIEPDSDGSNILPF